MNRINPAAQESGRRLHEARYRTGLTQEEVAAYLHIKRQTLSNYERGTRRVPPDTLAKLAVLYHDPDLFQAIIDR